MLKWMTDEWLPVAFFDDEHPDYPNWALTTFIHWVKSPNQFRHQQSNTWRGGPLGVRWVVAALRRITLSFRMLDDREGVPVGVQRVFSDATHKKQWSHLASLAKWLLESLHQSISALAETFPEPSQHWKAAVVTAHLAAETETSAKETPGPPMTNGVPFDRKELRRMFKELTVSDPDVTLGKNRRSARKTAPPTGRRRNQVTFDESVEAVSSSSEEMIDIPEFPDSDGSTRSGSSSASSRWSKGEVVATKGPDSGGTSQDGESDDPSEHEDFEAVIEHEDESSEGKLIYWLLSHILSLESCRQRSFSIPYANCCSQVARPWRQLPRLNPNQSRMKSQHFFPACRLKAHPALK